LTSLGTANTANAEANLTFDGSSLLITGSLTVAPTAGNIEFQVTSTGTKLGNDATDIHQITGSLVSPLLRITGSVLISGSLNTSSLALIGSGSNIFSVDGVSGRLFSVTDSFSGSLFSVNTVAGLPIIEAFSDNTVRMGQYGVNAFYISQSRVGIGKESALNSNLDVSGSVIITGSLTVNGSTIGGAFPFTGSAQITGSLSVTGAAVFQRAIDRKTGNYTLVFTDQSKIIEMNSGSANTVTIPGFATTNFPTGSFIDIIQYGAGQTTITGSVNIRSANGWLKINAQYGAATLTKIGGDEWYLIGNLNA
jgi:hypothetical protein